MAAALEQKADYDFTSEKPAPLVLLPEDDTDKALQLNNKSKNESAKIEYQLNLEQYNEKVEQFKQNKFKTYAIIWDKCSAMMKQSIEAQENYDKTKRDPYLLFDTIEGLSYNYQESKYPIEIIFDALKNFINLKQKDDEDLTSYLDRFKAANNNLKTQLGEEIILTNYIKTLDDYDENDLSNLPTLKKESYEELKAYVFLANSDRNKYNTLIKNLAQQQSLKNSQYPKTLKAATEALQNHPWDPKYHEEKKKHKNQSRHDNENNNNNNININGQPEVELSFAQLQNACYCCGKKGHGSDKCYKKDKIPKDEWYINKLQKQETNKIMAQVTNNDNASVSPSVTISVPQEATQEVAWSGAHVNLNQLEVTNLMETIMLDSGSSKSLFGNP